MIQVRVRVKDEQTLQAFREARKALNREVKLGLKAAAETAVPSVKAEAPRSSVHAGRDSRGRFTRGHMADQTRAGATTRAAFIEVRSRYAGVINFGGTVRTEIHPKPGGARAIRTPWGPRAVVKGPRTYQGAHFLERGVERVAGQMEDAMTAAALRPYERFFNVS